MLEDLQPIARVFSCAVRTLHEPLDPSDQKILISAITDTDTWTNKGLERALRARGLKISESAISKHRTAACSCPAGWPNA